MGLWGAMEGSGWSHYISYTLPFLVVSFRMRNERTKFMIIPSYSSSLPIPLLGHLLAIPNRSVIELQIVSWYNRIPESWRNAGCFVEPHGHPSSTVLERGGWFRKPWECCRSFESKVGYCSALVVYGENSTGMSFPSYHGSVPKNPDIRGNTKIDMAIHGRIRIC